MDPLAEVDDLIDAHEGEVTLRVTDLLYLFGRFNLNDRDVLAQQLADHGVAVDPPLSEVERSSVVRLRHADTAATAREPEIMRWVLRADGSIIPLADGAPAGGVLWIDVEAEGIAPEALDGVVSEALRAAGEDLAAEEVQRLSEQLRSHDHRPATHRYGTRVGSYASFAVAHDEDTPEDPADPLAPKTGRITFWPLEVAAGERFLISVRRAGERITARTRAHARDVHGEVQRCPVLAGQELEAELRRRWHRACAQDGDRTGGDAALLLLHWVADGAALALAEIEAWLRQWELHVLEHDGTPERITLVTLRDMLTEMEARTAFFAHPHHDDPVTGWVPVVTDPDEAHQTLAIVRRVARTVEMLQTRVRDRLVGVSHIADDRRGKRVESIGFVLLFPALVMGLFSLNTRTPGDGTWWGFAIVLTAIVGLTFAAHRFFSRR